jgi:hypothetical protein
MTPSISYNDAIAFLTRCADDTGTHYYAGHAVGDPADCPTCHGTNDAGHLGTPGSRYGRTSAHCAPVAYKVARIRTGSDGLTYDELDQAMRLVVNDSDGPQETINEYIIELAGADIDAMVHGYLAAKLWTQTDYDRTDEDCACEPVLDAHYDVSDIAPSCVDAIRELFTDVVTSSPLAVRMYLAKLGRYESARSGYDRSELFGHDFLLTRDGHGAGFWDRGLGELGEYLTQLTKPYGESDDLFDDGNGGLA